MSNLTIVIPLHKFDDEYKAMLEKAIASIDTTDLDADISVIAPKDIVAKVKETLKNPNVGYIENEESDYCHQVNVAAKKVKTPYFSILEVDDVFTKIWLTNVADYMAEYSDAIAYLPLTQRIDAENGKFIGFCNEVGWARGFYDKPGYLSIEGSMNYYDYNMSGAIINRDVFNSLGGLKCSIKVFFWYEFILRALNKGKNFFVIPKVGYKHYVNRKGSMMAEDSKMSIDEVRFWLKTAQEEYPFDKDRNKTYGGEE